MTTVKQLIYREGSGLIVALCEDDSVWLYDTHLGSKGAWRQLPTLPGTGRP